MPRLQIDITDTQEKDLEQLLNELKEFGIGTKKDLFNNALALFEWAVRERRRNRIIASIDEAAERFHEVHMPVLDRIRGAIRSAA
jgi:molecular chaperone GrpE (heat shock protein)